MNNQTIENAKKYAEELFQREATGHDFEHTQRVYLNALAIQKTAGGDLFLISLAAYLHDVDDVKLFKEEGDLPHARQFLTQEGADIENIEKICQIIHEISFKGKESVKPSTLEGQIVQDADRLDALGAIGIARAFAYGGAKGRKMYDPNVKPRLDMDEKTYRSNEGTTINHFYEKLLLLESLMNTPEGKKIAHERTCFMKDFLAEFFLENEGGK
ncbi:MAG: HD domain-containing protein [Bacilli bacterium]|nr:HD domain-containing protein [Bacilli bacterium]